MCAGSLVFVTGRFEGSDLVIPQLKQTKSGSWIDTQYFHKIRNLSQVPKRVSGGFVIAPEKIDVENVLPRPSPHRAGFNLAQADVPQGKNAQRLKQRPRDILDFEGNRGFVSTAGYQSVVVG